MKKIAYLCSEYPAVSQTFIFREIESLRRAGYAVTPISVHRQTRLEVMTEAEKEEAANTLVMTRLSLPAILGAHLHMLLRSPAGYLRMTASALALLTKGPKNPFKALAYWVEAGILRHWMHRRKIRHVHEHFAAPTAIVAMLAERYGGVSYSLSVHGPDIFFTQDSDLLAEKVHRAEFVRCISHFCRSQVMRITPPRHWEKLHIVRCGVDPAVYAPRPETTRPVPEILCVGRLVPAKGQHTLLAACARLKAGGIPFRLTMVGDGPDRASLEAYASETGLNGEVRFAGALGQEAVRACYDRADVFVLASFAEGVPVVLMEAMAKEIPVVSTRIAGIPELIDHETNGLLADAGDVGGLVRQMAGLIADPALRRRLGAAGRKKIEQRYHLHRNNRQMAALFQQKGEAS
jgi:glycosyltransferase involved in cell wall biosynthesis